MSKIINMKKKREEINSRKFRNFLMRIEAGRMERLRKVLSVIKHNPED
jgi:hypothetical protein